MAPSRSPPARRTDSYRPSEQGRSSDPRRRSRSRSPPRRRDGGDHYSPRRSRSPRTRSHPSRQPPLPNEAPPPLPNEPLPYDETAAPGTTPGAPGTSSTQSQVASKAPDDGWAPVWEPSVQAYYFCNRFTGASQWENPRVPEATQQSQSQEADKPRIKPAAAGGYNPAIHGSYDPNADYAREERHAGGDASADPNSADTEQNGDYAATAQFNRFTGRFQNTEIHPTHTPNAHTDEAKSRRQMSAYFDVDAAANAHDGKSLRAERQNRKLTKEELKAFREKKKNRKEEKRRAWLRD